MISISFAYDRKGLFFLGIGTLFDRRGGTPFAGGLRLRYPPQKFSAFLTMLNKIEIGQTITLTYCEQKLAHFVARHRNGNNRHFNVVNLKISAQSPLTVDLEGIAGEIAFCRLFNVYPDLDTDRPPPHPFYDATIPPPPGYRIDVKTTKYDNGKLLVDARKDSVKTSAVDFYVLMTGTFPGPYTYRGMIAREIIIAPHRIETIKGYRSYVATQDELVANPVDATF
jgi:hypothetical protein